MDKRWTLAIVTILMVILIYAFLSMILKTDKTKPAHSRMYRDYSSYSKKDNDDSDNYIFERRTYASAAEARKTKRTMFDNIVTYSANSYNQFLQDSIKTPQNKEFFKTVTNPQYQHMIKLSQISLPELQSAISAFRNGEYETAVSFLNTALNKLDPMEMKKRIEIYSLLAECSIKLKDNDGYIQNKIRQIRIQRKYQKLLKETFPDYPNPSEFMTTQEASTNLLRIKSSVAKLPDSPMVREMVKKAELDLEVARKVTQ